MFILMTKTDNCVVLSPSNKTEILEIISNIDKETIDIGEHIEKLYNDITQIQAFSKEMSAYKKMGYDTGTCDYNTSFQTEKLKIDADFNKDLCHSFYNKLYHDLYIFSNVVCQTAEKINKVDVVFSDLREYYEYGVYTIRDIYNVFENIWVCMTNISKDIHSIQDKIEYFKSITSMTNIGTLISALNTQQHYLKSVLYTYILQIKNTFRDNRHILQKCLNHIAYDNENKVCTINIGLINVDKSLLDELETAKSEVENRSNDVAAVKQLVELYAEDEDETNLKRNQLRLKTYQETLAEAKEKVCSLEHKIIVDKQQIAKRNIKYTETQLIELENDISKLKIKLRNAEINYEKIKTTLQSIGLYPPVSYTFTTSNSDVEMNIQKYHTNKDMLEEAQAELAKRESVYTHVQKQNVLANEMFNDILNELNGLNEIDECKD